MSASICFPLQSPGLDGSSLERSAPFCVSSCGADPDVPVESIPRARS